MKKYTKIICMIAAVCLLGTAAFCSFHIYSHYAHESEQEEVFEKIAEVVEQAQTGESETTDVLRTEEETVLAEYGELYLQNTDMVGWLSIAGTNINYPVMQTLRVHDWAIFNSDRRYYQRMQETGTYLEEVATDMTQPEIKTVEDFLDNIENQQLYQVLIKVDRLTLRIAFMKVQGYSTREIASYLRITEKAVYRRLDRLKEKIQKIFE